MRVADYIFEFIARQGVKEVFLLPGGGAMHLVDALGSNPDLTFVATHHEQAAAIAAEAYSRVNENLGVALVTTGPGGLNAVTPVAGAWIESVPLLILSGQVKRADLMGDSGVRQMGVQEADVVSVVKPITKYAVTVTEPAEIRYHLEKAVHLARGGRQGPVWLDIPLDVQAARIDPGRLVGYRPEAGEAPPPLDGEQVRRIVALLERAERPLILAGHGVRLAGAAHAFLRLCEAWQVPVASTWNAMDLIPYEHPLCVGKPGVVALRGPNFAIQNCDLLIAIGCRLDHVVTAYNPRAFARAARKVVVDVDRAELDKLDMEVSEKVHAGAGEVIDALSATSPVARDRSAWLERCQGWKRRYPVNDGKPFDVHGAISHYQFVDALSEAIPPDTLVSTGSSGLGIEAFYTVFRNKPGQRVFLTSGLGAMGYGLPAAIGACLANGRKPMVAVESDGSLQLNLQELSTLKGLNLPIRLFVLNNEGYASIRNTQRNYFDGRYVATGPEGGLFLPDVGAVAEAIGLPVIRIGEVAGLRAGIDEVLAHPGPVVCDVRLVRDEVLWPKVAALPQPDGSMLSMPLEDMSPLLPLDELRENMMVELDVASLEARRRER